MTSKKCILLNLPNADRLSTRRLIGGIIEEVERHPDLQILILPYFSDRMRERIEEGAFAGMITEGGYPDGPPGLLGSIPMVGIRHPNPIGKLPRVLEDPHTVAKKVLDHFLGEGLTSFGTFHNMNSQHPEGRFRSEAFLECVRKEGLTGQTFPNGPRCADKWSFEGQLADLEDWLRTLPTPCGILCGDDDHAHRILMAAEQGGIDIPTDLAILGYGDDPFYCETAHQGLSSIDPGYETLGKECVRRLVEEIDGHPRPGQVTWVDCATVIRRKTADRRFGDFPYVKRAVQLLEEDLPSITSAQQLADILHISHTALNQRFRAATGQSTWAFVKNQRMEKALKLLKTTDLTLADICAETGVSSISKLSTDVRKFAGKSPREIRAQAR